MGGHQDGLKGLDNCETEYFRHIGYKKHSRLPNRAGHIRDIFGQLVWAGEEFQKNHPVIQNGSQKR